MKQKLFYLFAILINLLVIASASTNRLLKQHCTLSTEGTDSPKFFDLRSLSLKNKYFTVKNNSDIFLINICSNSNLFLSSQNETLCSKSTTICWTKEDNNNSVELGKLYSNTPNFDEQGNVEITFNSRKSLEPKCTQIETKITFVCKLTRALKGEPILKRRTDCGFEFEWQTSEACLDEHNKIEPHFKNESLVFSIGNNKTIDLEPIFAPQTIIDNSSEDKYHFAIARNMAKYLQDVTQRNQYAKVLSPCDNAFVCQLKLDRQFVRPIGKLNGSTLNHDGRNFHLILPSDSKCGRAIDRNSTSVIFNLYCDGEAKNITEFVAENNLCGYIFDLYDPKVCEFEKLLAQVNATSTTTLKPVDNKSDANEGSTTVRSGSITDQNAEKVTENSKTVTSPLDQGTQNDQTKKLLNIPRDQPSTNSNSNTTLFGFIIFVIVSVVGIVLAIISLMNDDRRAWLQNRVRRVIRPQAATSFHYSQLSTAKVLLTNNNQHETLSPYSPTVIPKGDQMRYETLENESNQKNRFNLRNNSSKVQSSIREQLDRLRLVNDNDLGVSRNDFHSMSYRTDKRSNSKDEAELNLLT